MNRVVLVGNGFDLAHKLPTKYQDFIDWYFRQLMKYIPNGSYFSQNTIPFGDITLKFDGFVKFEDYGRFKDEDNTYKDFCDLLNCNSKALKITFLNSFLKRICDYYENSDFKWLDIENIYFEELKKITKAGNNEESKIQVQKLNEEVSRIENTLGEYLREMSEKYSGLTPSQDIMTYIYSHIDPNEISVSGFEAFRDYLFGHLNTYNFLDENIKMQKIDDKSKVFPNMISNKETIGSFIYNKGREIKTAKLSDITAGNIPDYFLLPNNILFLNFNYTYTDELYRKPISKHLHIHGEIKEQRNNPIVLGYGDEFCEKYKELEEYADNCYLGKIKSSRYLQTNNYREFLTFIESEPYQVIVMGHSCGNTDRTLLRTLFEHDNCLSIKPYYYIDPEKGDNYSDITMSISRIFSDKAKMRDRVVNKTKCLPLTEK